MNLTEGPGPLTLTFTLTLTGLTGFASLHSLGSLADPLTLTQL